MKALVVFSFVVTLLFLSSFLPVKGLDTVPPQIIFVDIKNAIADSRPIIEDEPISINAIVEDDVVVRGVALYYRRPGENYVRSAMPKCPTCSNTYNTTIPASHVTTATIEYYINATDGTNIATYPATNPTTNPNVINVNLYPTAVVLNSPTDITENSVKLNWNESPDADFKNYTIYQSNVPGELGNPICDITDKTITTFTVTGLAANTTYYFTTRVYDTGDLYADSNNVTATTLPKQDETSFQWTLIIAGVALAAGLGITAAYIVKRRKPKFKENQNSLRFTGIGKRVMID